MALLMRRRRRALARMMAAGALVCSLAAAQQDGVSEDAVKAAFLYNFTKFVDWPESAFASPEFTVCVFADAGFRRELDAILDREHVHGRPVRIREPREGDDLKGCQMVYFGRREGNRPAKLLAGLRQAPVLTVGEGPRFLQQGGLVAFLLESDHVRFDISKRGADAAGLSVSSKLLRIARKVEGAPAP